MQRVLIDSGPLAALFDADDRWHVRTMSFLRAYRGELLCSAANVTEAVWIASNASHAVATNLIAWLGRGAVSIFNIEQRDLARIGTLFANANRVAHQRASGVICLAARLTENTFRRSPGSTGR